MFTLILRFTGLHQGHHSTVNYGDINSGHFNQSIVGGRGNTNTINNNTPTTPSGAGDTVIAGTQLSTMTLLHGLMTGSRTSGEAGPTSSKGRG